MPVSEQLTQVAIYARQIFIQQPNRRFVRLLILSGEHFRLFHFDRSGVQYTPLVNFHDDPHTFVRVVLGLSSPDESDIGLDSSIQWTIENGQKVSGTLRTHTSEGQEVVYPLSSVEPFFFSWITGEELVVKDSWREDDRVSEHVYLEDALGIPGLVQMVSCEPDRGQTKDLHGFGDTIPAGFHNRVETRIVMKSYGKSIQYFTSAMQVVCALRDAIAGHMELYKEGTLHRDVSIYNVLLGKPDAEPGYRGILIDLDMAIRRNRGSSTDWRVGTRFYHSIAVLRGKDYHDPLPRDHLDDLESFFYILAQIIFGYDPLGASHPLLHPISRWDADDCELAAAFKESVFTWDFLPSTIEERWPAPCCNLIVAFGTFLGPLARKKHDVNRRTLEQRKYAKSKDMLTKVHEHYTHVLQLFDRAIYMLGRPESEWRLDYESSSDSASCSSSTSNHPENRTPVVSPATRSRKAFDLQEPFRTPLKRTSDSYPEGQPAAKRLNAYRTPRRPIVPPPRRNPHFSRSK
ncbi:hypothetical protein EST38_g8398 [Candolleomyces aberdarensis]|uniref:Fungal-type protein kinase domain-containing protein n=1 Tax=Candolleomyces aberdarensis TaxID=2316362 RepID=A0A4Q2DEQ1_9AGAR|nr:hypothetical protein EST38_g8398 [Candolleomyces aberdarensis]